MEEFRDVGLRLEVFGTRGSNSIFGDGFAKYGGSTSCYLLEANDGNKKEAIILDAGTGLFNINELNYDEITILLSHVHLDHVLGLPVFPCLSDARKKISIYLACRKGVSAKEQLDALFSEPYWPCKLSDYKAKIEILDMPQTTNTEMLPWKKNFRSS
ncbi:MAG: MBL fold metallo-hydrolase [Butyrivibrio sp.]|nr:MBL fold metallo-hydrolase [Butyrivibrio sp.]